MIKRHPSKYDLFAHAESVASGQPIDARLAAHLKNCARCHAEVEAIRSSLEVTGDLAPVEPSDDFAENILRKAHAERQRMGAPRHRSNPIAGALKVSAIAATLLVAAALYFSAVSGPISFTDAPAIRPDAPAQLSAGAEDQRLQRTRSQIETLSGAVGARHSQESSDLILQEQRNALMEQEADISAAVSALETNPGSERARQVVNAAVKQQAEGLKQLYTDRNL